MAQLYFHYSSMNAGKSTHLLQSSFNYKERGMKTKLFTAAIDDRFGVGKITSRIGVSEDAALFNTKTNLFEEVFKEKPDCVLIDESQFLTKQHVWQLTEVVDKLGIPVMCYGIRTDFQGELFPGSQWLLAWADKVVELKTICHCGKKATMVVRMDKDGNVLRDGEQVEVGGNDRYVSLCRKHFKEAHGL